ncbi:hypothetical protein DFR30_0860 [Thiogranum longum]|uniref:Transferrin-binding protein B C-lobe/N-lobe beta barrel domain-containing protein n=1 Tax=Thiogranum longum TaxID=1537524 RepID=A0A4R1HBN1_9GAMM|nr:hypothetical protein [Thiogranum longum]TCK17625.1 hypothetical protein DFR30_0860 [Thiogranum longum]
MNTARNIIVASIALALGLSSVADAAKKKEEDSAYKWGRWAILSPAAGGPETYVAKLTPEAAHNTRPQDSDEFHPELADTPVEVTNFCSAGSNCGYATYYTDDGMVEAASAVEGYDQSENNPGGPVLARFNLEASDSADTSTGVEAAAVGGGAGGVQQVNFEVTGTENPDFPDIASVDMEGEGSYTGTVTSREIVREENGIRVTQQSQTSTLTEQFDFDADTGSWSDEQLTQTRINTGGPVNPPIIDFFSANGYFAFGSTPTIEQMETFAAGNVTAIYQGVVLDYNSAVTMEFNLGNDTVVGRFASENGFNGFEATGAVEGVNFTAADGDNGFVGSFFSGGENASGAVKNATQLGIFSADHIVDAK